MQRQPQTTKLRIGQLAAAVDLNPNTIRYYEQLGLLTPSERTAAGYQCMKQLMRSGCNSSEKRRRWG